MIFNAISLFSSAGIAETYFERNNVFVKVAAELLPERVRFYKDLYPETEVFQGDITDDSLYSQIIDSAKKHGCDFLLATPPCQGMSTAGLQKKDDPRNRLILSAIQAILDLMPKFAILENVPEILATSIFYHDKWIKIDDLLKDKLGALYRFNETKVVNAMHYGVAQSRERCIYLLARKDQNINWEFPPAMQHCKTMRDVIGDLPSLDPDVTDISEEERKKIFPDFEKKKIAGQKVSPWHIPPRHKIRHVISMMHTPEGCSAWNNQIFYPTLKDGSKSKGYKNTYKRQWWDKPAYTVTKYTSRLGSQENGHPGRVIVDSPNEADRLWSDARVLSIFELMRVSSLPDDWNIPAWASSNLIREIIGEGIPPLLLEQAIIALQRSLNEKS